MTGVPQFTPTVSDSDVDRVVARDFHPRSHAAILEKIRSITVREKPRVILACLKNARGDVAKLNNELDNSEGSWREIISEAEYPNYSQMHSVLRSSATDQEAQIIEKDRLQYLAWLNR